MSKSYAEEIMNRAKSDEKTIITQELMVNKTKDLNRSLHITLNVLK